MENKYLNLTGAVYIISKIKTLLEDKSDKGHTHSKEEIGLGNVENKSSQTIRGELTSDNVIKALGYTPAGMEKGFSVASLFPDYSMAGMPEWIGYILSAVVGVAIIVIFFKLLSGSKKDKIDFSKGQSV